MATITPEIATYGIVGGFFVIAGGILTTFVLKEKEAQRKHDVYMKQLNSYGLFGGTFPTEPE